MANVSAALLPVLAFLAVLYTMDGFKLVPIRWVLFTLVSGGAAALLSLWLWTVLGLGAQAGQAATYYDAPILEETLKAIVLVALMLRGRIGFLVDAAVLG